MKNQVLLKISGNIRIGGSNMDISRKIGIGIVMIIPTFVGCGVLWEIFHSWIAVIIWIAIMAFVHKNIICNKFSPVQ